MKTLFVILSLSLVTILVTLGAMWWRLRWHWRRSQSQSQSQSNDGPKNDALKNALAEIQPDQHSADTN